MPDMTFEMFGAGCFGLVIGFVAFHAFSGGGTAFDVKQLGAFIAALLGAVVLAAFPAGTTLFAAYASGLAIGFFLVPASRVIAFVSSAALVPPTDVHSEVADQLKYVEEHWPEVEGVVQHALARHKGLARSNHLRALPLDDAGRVSVLRRYARTHPESASFGQSFFGWTLRVDRGT